MSIPHIPGYEILETLPRGGMSVVYKARQLSLNRVVALKTLSGDLIREASDIEQFRAEARLTANLNHPHIVRVYDFGKTPEGVYYFAMQLIKGSNIAAWIRSDGFLSEHDTLLVAQSIAEALDYAWQESGVIHRDIKPANVLVDDDGTVKVVDLGVAQSMNRARGGKRTEANELAGTPEYMAPEQIRCDTPLDSRCDIYALGAMMYHCLTGIKPFQGLPPEKIMDLQETGYIQDPRDIRPELSVAMACLVETFLAKDRKFRPADWGEVRQELERVRLGQNPERILPGPGISTVMRNPDRARLLVDMTPVTVKGPSKASLFLRNSKRFVRPKWLAGGLLSVGLLVFAGWALRSPSIFKHTNVASPTSTTNGNRSVLKKTAANGGVVPFEKNDAPVPRSLGGAPQTQERPGPTGEGRQKAKAEPSFVPKIETIPSPAFSAAPSNEPGERTPQERLTAALEWARTHEACYDDILGRFRQVAEETRGTPQEAMAAEELRKWHGLKQDALAAGMKAVADQAEALANQGRLLDAAKLLDEYSGLWRNETSTDRERLALDYRERFKRQEELASKCRVEIARIQRLLVERNPKLAPEQIDVQIVDGKVVRVEIISLFVSDLRPLSELVDLQALVCMAFKPDANKDSAKSAPLEDLSPLKGLRLRELYLFGTRVKDLTPLQGLPLETLDISNTCVKDLAPLKNMPLTSLHIAQTAVRDLKPIMNLPIKRIALDFNPLKMRRDTDREFWAVLRRMPSLKNINDRLIDNYRQFDKKLP